MATILSSRNTTRRYRRRWERWLDERGVPLVLAMVIAVMAFAAFEAAAGAQAPRAPASLPIAE